MNRVTLVPQRLDLSPQQRSNPRKAQSRQLPRCPQLHRLPASAELQCRECRNQSVEWRITGLLCGQYGWRRSRPVKGRRSSTGRRRAERSVASVLPGICRFGRHARARRLIRWRAAAVGSITCGPGQRRDDASQYGSAGVAGRHTGPRCSCSGSGIGWLDGRRYGHGRNAAGPTADSASRCTGPATSSSASCGCPTSQCRRRRPGGTDSGVGSAGRA